MNRSKLFFPIVGVFLISTVVAAYFYSQGYRLNVSVDKSNYQIYEHTQAPKFSFRYDAQKFEIDTDPENRFGETYLVGIKSPHDARVGCDVRATSGQLSLDGNVDEIGSKLAKQISQNADVFRHESSRFITVGNEKAIRLEITFNGPLNETMRMSQIFTQHGNQTFTLICGTTKGTYKFFAPQFERFFESFQFTE